MDLIDKYVEYAKISTDSPELYHKVASYWIASTLLGRYASVQTSYTTIIPNVWAIIIGPSRVTRKTTAMYMAERIIREINKDMIFPASFSPEAIYEELSSVKDGEARAWVKDEIGGFFKALDKNYMRGTRELLSSLYSGRGETRVLRKERFVIPDRIYMTVIATMPTPPHNYFSDEDFTSGFANRFLLVQRLERDGRTIPIMGADSNASLIAREELIEQYKALIAKYRDKTLIINFDYESTNILTEFEKRVDEEIIQLEKENPNSLFKSYISEMPTYLIKLAVLRKISDPAQEVLDNRITVVNKEHVSTALKDLQEFIESAKEVIKDVEEGVHSEPAVSEEKSLTRLYNIIEQGEENGRTKTEIMLKMQLGSKRVNELLVTLVEQGKIVMIRCDENRGRPSYKFLASTYGTRYNIERLGCKQVPPELVGVTL